MSDAQGTVNRRCKCGCGAVVPGSRVFVNIEHQLEWMAAGGARDMNARQSPAAKARGGQTAGRLAAKSGALQSAAAAGAQKIREVAEAVRARRAPKK